MRNALNVSVVGVWQWLPVAGALVLGTMAVPAIRFLAGMPGDNLPEDDLAADYLFGLWYGLVLTLLVIALPANRSERKALLFLWFMRVLVVAGPMLLFEAHYTHGADEFGYYEQGKWGLVPSFGIGDGTQIMVAVTAALYRVGLHSFRAIEMTFAMIGLLGVYLFYRAAVMFLSHESPKLLLIVGLMPSILFWSSIVGKDPIVMFGVSFYVFGAVGLCTRRQLYYLVPVSLGLFVAASIRLWMAPVMCCWLLAAALTMRRHLALKIILGTLSFAAMIFLARAVLTKFSVASQGQLLETLDQTQHEFNIGGSRGEGEIQVAGWGDALKFAPRGAFAAFFRPLPGEVMNPFGIMAGIEDLGFLVLFARALVRLRRRDFSSAVIMGTIGMLLVWSLFYAFVSSGNLGAAVRYRLQVLPMLIMLLLYLGRGKDFALKRYSRDAKAALSFARWDSWEERVQPR